MFIIPIDSKSIRPNPNAGRHSRSYAGKKREEPDGSISSDTHTLYSFSPEPKFLYSYLDVNVQCNDCKKQFSYEKLEISSSWEHGEYVIENMCPYCQSPDCCEVKFEEFDETKHAIS